MFIKRDHKYNQAEIKMNTFYIFKLKHLHLIFVICLLIFTSSCQQTPKQPQTAGHSCTHPQSRFNSPVSTTSQEPIEVNKEDMVLIPGGTFSKGGDDNQAWRDEYPKHEVVVDSFWMDVHEVTNA